MERFFLFKFFPFSFFFMSTKQTLKHISHRQFREGGTVSAPLLPNRSTTEWVNSKNKCPDLLRRRRLCRSRQSTPPLQYRLHHHVTILHLRHHPDSIPAAVTSLSLTTYSSLGFAIATSLNYVFSPKSLVIIVFTLLTMEPKEKRTVSAHVSPEWGFFVYLFVPGY